MDETYDNTDNPYTDDDSGSDDSGDSRNEVTDLLLAWSRGDQDARDRVMLLMQDELRRMAHGRLRRERDDITLETLELVNEMALRLLRCKSVAWRSSSQFRGEASMLMRNVLVDHARHRDAKIRNNGVRPIALDLVPEIALKRDEHLIALDEALNTLEKAHRIQYEAIIRHYFGGQTRIEIAKDMKIPEIRAHRHIRAGRSFLRRHVEKQ